MTFQTEDYFKQMEGSSALFSCTYNPADSLLPPSKAPRLNMSIIWTISLHFSSLECKSRWSPKMKGLTLKFSKSPQQNNWMKPAAWHRGGESWGGIRCCVWGSQWSTPGPAPAAPWPGSSQTPLCIRLTWKARQNAARPPPWEFLIQQVGVGPESLHF